MCMYVYVCIYVYIYIYTYVDMYFTYTLFINIIHVNCTQIKIHASYNTYTIVKITFMLHCILNVHYNIHIQYIYNIHNIYVYLSISEPLFSNVLHRAQVFSIRPKYFQYTVGLPPSCSWNNSKKSKIK